MKLSQYIEKLTAIYDSELREHGHDPEVVIQRCSELTSDFYDYPEAQEAFYTDQPGWMSHYQYRAREGFRPVRVVVVAPGN